jgi:segregation and condensation protein B
VNTSGVLKTLLDKRMIVTAGRKEVIGRPILYKTSKEFLMRFGLSDLDELPSLKEFEALAREALGGDEGIAPSQVTSGEWPFDSAQDKRVASENPEKSVSRADVVGSEAAHEQMEAREELLEETAANNEGMPEAASDGPRKAAAAGE